MLRGNVWERTNLLFDRAIDDACKNISRAFFLPSHPTGTDHVFRVFDGRLLRVSDLPELPADFNKPRYYTATTLSTEGSGRVGDDYNCKATNETTAKILEAGDWTVRRSSSSCWTVRRPGKNTPGPSGTIGHHGPGILYVFSANAAPFEQNRAYKPFSVFGLLVHGGDFAAAAKDLAAKGHGQPSCQRNGTPHHGHQDGSSPQERNSDGSKKRRTQVDLLVEIGSDADLFLSGDEAYATIRIANRFETHRLNSDRFRRWLRLEYLQRYDRNPSSTQAMQNALDILDALVYAAGNRQPIFTRIAAAEDVIYLDLADEDLNVVEIRPHSWRMVQNPPVKFIRPKAMLPLPIPQRGGLIDDLGKFLNLDANGDDLRLIIAWLLSSFQPCGARPILNLGGEQGTAKSSTTKRVRNLVDPNQAPTRTMPKDTRDLMISAQNSAVVAYDNVSYLPDWLSDALCSLATGQGFATKANYTDDQEVIIEARRPVIINGINGSGTRSDFLDRCLIINLPVIKEDARCEERQLDAEFRRLHPQLLGALLDAAAAGLANLPTTTLPKKPRLADFAVWVTACTKELGWEKSFLDIYTMNRQEATSIASEASCLIQTLYAWLNRRPDKSWSGYTKALLEGLRNFADEPTKKQADFPLSPESLGKSLTRVAPVLRARGVEVDSVKDKGGKKWKFRIAEPSPENSPMGDNCADGLPSPTPFKPSPSPEPSLQPSSKNATIHKGFPDFGLSGDGCDGFLPLYSLLTNEKRKRRGKEEETIGRKPSRPSPGREKVVL